MLGEQDHLSSRWNSKIATQVSKHKFNILFIPLLTDRTWRLGSLWLFFQSNFSGFKAVYIDEHYRKVSSHCTAPSLSVRLPPQVWLDFQHREELSVITSTQTKMIEKT